MTVVLPKEGGDCMSRDGIYHSACQVQGRGGGDSGVIHWFPKLLVHHCISDAKDQRAKKDLKQCS